MVLLTGKIKSECSLTHSQLYDRLVRFGEVRSQNRSFLIDTQVYVYSEMFSTLENDESHLEQCRKSLLYISWCVH